MSKKQPSFIFLILLCVIGAVVLFLFTWRHFQATPSWDGEYSVELSAVSNGTDVYVDDLKTGAKSLFLTVPDVYFDHYHPAEFYNGHLYIITENSGGTRFLKCYDQSGQSEVIFSASGLDFRVSPNEIYIAIVAQSSSLVDQGLVFLDGAGRTIRTFSADELGLSSGEIALWPLGWADETFWLKKQTGLSLVSVLSINLSSFLVQDFNLEAKNILACDLAFDDDFGHLVYSDFCSLDGFSVGEAINDSFVTHLYLYDLAEGNGGLIATATAKDFEPVWLDDTTIEYNTPEGGGRISSVVVP